jgi:hypothetical protein
MVMRKTVVLVVFLLLAIPACGWTEGGRFKDIYIGEPLSALPFKCDKFSCRGRYQSLYARVYADNGNNNVAWFSIIYSEDQKWEGWEIKVTASPIPLLSQAVKVHSLQPGFSKPEFGYARDVNGHVYGVVDMANRISYNVLSPLNMGPDSSVSEVSYLENEAPVLQHAKESPLSERDSEELLEAAENSPPYTGSVEVYDSIEEKASALAKDHEDLRAATRSEAIDKLNAQVDVAIGKGRRTLALIKSLERWYEIDKDNPDARTEAAELREFYPAFQKEYDKLYTIINLNEDLWKGGHSLQNEAYPLILEPFNLQKEVESQMRRLKAMGFEP